MLGLLQRRKTSHTCAYVTTSNSNTNLGRIPNSLNLGALFHGPNLEPGNRMEAYPTKTPDWFLKWGPLMQQYLGFQFENLSTIDVSFQSNYLMSHCRTKRLYFSHPFLDIHKMLSSPILSSCRWFEVLTLSTWIITSKRKQLSQKSCTSAPKAWERASKTIASQFDPHRFFWKRDSLWTVAKQCLCRSLHS